MAKNVIYVSPNIEDRWFDLQRTKKMSKEEKVRWAEWCMRELGSSCVCIFSLEAFELAFNELNLVSDEGYIFFV